jgi:class 3 adenylate cyclase
VAHPLTDVDLLSSVVEPTWPRAAVVPEDSEAGGKQRLPRAGSPDFDLLEAEVEERRTRWDAGVSRLLAIMSLVAAFVVIVAWDEVGRTAAQALLLLTMIAGLYFTIHWRLLLGGQPSAQMRWFNSTVEGLLPTLAILIIARFRGPEWALALPVFMAYVVLIAASGARLRPKMCLYTGAVAVLGYLALYYVVLVPALAQSSITTPSSADWVVWQRALMLAVCSGLVAYAAVQIRDLAMSVGAEMWHRRVLEREFQRYVSHGVANAILSGNNAAERRDVTVLFCDLRDFTALCEQQPPEQVVALLNSFYERACQIVQAHGGTVNKFLGDGLLALFGAPNDLPNHVSAGAQAAHEIMYAADELKAEGGIWQHLDIGIGLDSGPVVMGDVGASSRAEYTAIGTTVNRAARLQGLSREAHRRIVLSQDTARRLGPRANVVGMGSVKLKGLSAPVEVYAFRHS